MKIEKLLLGKDLPAILKDQAKFEEYGKILAEVNKYPLRKHKLKKYSSKVKDVPIHFKNWTILLYLDDLAESSKFETYIFSKTKIISSSAKRSTLKTNDPSDTFQMSITYKEFIEKEKGFIVRCRDDIYIISGLEQTVIKKILAAIKTMKPKKKGPIKPGPKKKEPVKPESKKKDLQEVIEFIFLHIMESEYKRQKKYDELKRTVNVFEQISRIDDALEKIKFNREPIPEDIRMFVWRRDEGKCVKCNSQKSLEFDHIIPYSKGGSNTARNLQILCQNCNRKKSDKI